MLLELMLNLLGETALSEYLDPGRYLSIDSSTRRRMASRAVLRKQLQLLGVLGAAFLPLSFRRRVQAIDHPAPIA